MPSRKFHCPVSEYAALFLHSISTAEFDMDRVILYQLYKMQMVASLSLFLV